MTWEEETRRLERFEEIARAGGSDKERARIRRAIAPALRELRAYNVASDGQQRSQWLVEVIRTIDRATRRARAKKGSK